MKHKKHDYIVQNKEKARQNQLEKIGTKLLKKDDLNQKLRGRKTDLSFLKLFNLDKPNNSKDK